MKKIFTLIFVSLFLLTGCLDTNDSDDKKEIKEKEKESITAPDADKKEESKKEGEKEKEDDKKDKDKGDEESKNITRIINDMAIGDTIDQFTLTSFRDGDIVEFYLEGNGSCKGVFAFDDVITGSYYVEYKSDFLKEDAYLIYDEKSIPFKRPFTYAVITEEEARNLLPEDILERAKNGEKFDVELEYSGFGCSQTPNEPGSTVDILTMKVLDSSAGTVEINDELALIKFISENNGPEDIDPNIDYITFSYDDFNNDGRLDVACYSTVYNDYPDVKFISNKNGYYEFINTNANLLHNMNCSVYKDGDFVLCQMNDMIGNDMLYIMRYNQNNDSLTFCMEGPLYYKKRELVQKDEYLDSPHTIATEIIIEQINLKPWEKFKVEETKMIEESGEELFKSITEYTFDMDNYLYNTEYIGGGYLDMQGE